MMKSARFRYLLLAVMVTVSHVVLVSHVTAHFQPAFEQCELCVSQAQPMAAIPAAEPPDIVPRAADTVRPGPVHASIGAAPAFFCFQRAPPTSSS